MWLLASAVSVCSAPCWANFLTLNTSPPCLTRSYARPIAQCLVYAGDNGADYDYHDAITSVIRVPPPLPPQGGFASVIDTPGYDMPDAIIASPGSGSNGIGSYHQLSIVGDDLDI